MALTKLNDIICLTYDWVVTHKIGKIKTMKTRLNRWQMPRKAVAATGPGSRHEFGRFFFTPAGTASLSAHMAERGSVHVVAHHPFAGGRHCNPILQLNSPLNPEPTYEKSFFQTPYWSLFAFILFAIFAATHLASAQEWTGGGADEYWMDAANWFGVAPVAGNQLEFGTFTDGGSLLLTNNFPADTAFNGITFDDSYLYFETTLFTLFGNPVLLSGAVTGNTVGVANASSDSQAVNLEMDLDWGYYTFSGGSAGLALNAPIRPFATYGVGFYVPRGGVAYFSGSGIMSPAPLDPAGTGLISGLGGAGLIGTNALASPALATVRGGAVVPYTDYDTLPTGGGTISSSLTANIELADNSAGITGYIANNIFVNTITIDKNTGNSGGSQTITVTNIGTLTLGYLGGIYVTSPGSEDKQIFKLTGGTLTAAFGGVQSGMIVLGINGTTSGNQMQLDSIVADDNGSPVTLVKTGPGSMYMSQNNTYSGGTYIDQGYLQVNTSSGLGSGPVYLANDAEVYLQANNGTWANNFFISPGAGPSYSQLGAIKIGSGNSVVTLSGLLTLLGAPVTGTPGDQIAMGGANGELLLAGPITGTGTLELRAEAPTVYMDLGNDTLQPNNWTGGLLIDNAGNNHSYVYDLGNQLAGNNVTLAQSGSGVAELFFYGVNDTMGGLIAASSPNNIVADPGYGPSTLTLGAGDATATFGGVITDAGPPYTLSIVKIGNGTQTFNGANTYSGDTTISAGTLALSGTGSLASPQINVLNGATFDVSGVSSPPFVLNPNQVLSGDGTVNGDVFIQGIVHPAGGGTAPNTLTFNNSVILNGVPGGGAPYNLEFDLSSSYDGDNDQIVLAGDNSTLSGTANGIAIGLTDPNGALDTTHDYVLIKLTGASASIAANSFNPTPGWHWYLSSNPNAAEYVIVTTPTEVLLHYGPAITQQPVNQTPCAGSSTSFAVAASGNSALVYQWQVDTDGSGVNWTSITDGTGTGTTYNIPATTLSQNGYMYRVSVTDGAGVTTTSSPATLTVVDCGSFAITQQPVTQTVCLDSAGTTSFNVGVSGANGTVTYQWEVEYGGDGYWSPITLDDSYFAGSTTSQLEAEIDPYAGQTFRCLVTDNDGTIVSSPATLTPVDCGSFAITQQPVTQTVCLDSAGTTSFNVGVSGANGTVTYQWEVEYGGDGYWSPITLDDSYFAGSTTSQLEAEIDPYAGQTFRCLVTDNDGTIVSSSATLTPVDCGSFAITQQPVNATACNFSQATFTVATSGANGPVTYQWETDDGVGNWVPVTDEISFYGPSSGYTSPQLEVTGSTDNGVGDNGFSFRCLVTDSDGTIISSPAMLTVSEPPSAATVGSAQTICPGSATAGLGGNTPAVGAGIWTVVSGGTGTFSSASDPNATFTHTGGSGPFDLRWTISNPPCPDSWADVTINIYGPPIPAANLWGTAQDHVVTVPVANLVAYATSPSGGTPTITAVSPASAQGGTVSLASGSVAYTPPIGYTGPDSFTYTLNDGCSTAQGTVSVTITPTTAPLPNQVAIPLVSTCVNLLYSGSPGQEYVVQWESSLNGPWMDLSGALTANANGLVIYSDCRSPLPSSGFYQIRLGP